MERTEDEILKEMEEVNPLNMLKAVFAAGVATELREGRDTETAYRNTHAAIQKDLGRKHD